MANFTTAIKKIFNPKELAIFFVTVNILIFFVSVGFNQYLEVKRGIELDRIAREKLELAEQDISQWFTVHSIKNVQESYPVGTLPSFHFDSQYFRSGKVTGDNVLRCDNYRSDVYKASGFVTDDRVGTRPTESSVPFTFSGDIPDFPTSCVLRSTITLCDERYKDVCKSWGYQSEKPFKFTSL